MFVPYYLGLIEWTGSPAGECLIPAPRAACRALYTMPYAVCRMPYAQFAHPPCAPPYAVLPFVMRCMPCCRTSYAMRRTLHAYCRARVSPYAVRNTRSAVLPHYRTAVRRAAVPPHSHVPYCRTAALPYAALRYYSCPTWGRIITISGTGGSLWGAGAPPAVRRTPYCRTPYCRTAVLPYAVLPYAVHHMPYAVLPYCRTPYAVRRTPCAVRRTAVRRTPYTVPYA